MSIHCEEDILLRELSTQVTQFSRVTSNIFLKFILLTSLQKLVISTIQLQIHSFMLQVLQKKPAFSDEIQKIVIKPCSTAMEFDKIVST